MDSTDTPTVGYTVTSQIVTTQTYNGQAGTRGMLITIQVGSSQTGELFVPLTDYTPEKVKPQLAALAASIAAIGTTG